MFLLLCAALARLPYLAAFIAFEAATFTLYLIVMRRILAGRGWTAMLPVLAFPPLFWVLGLGQNTFLTSGPKQRLGIFGKSADFLHSCERACCNRERSCAFAC